MPAGQGDDRISAYGQNLQTPSTSTLGLTPSAMTTAAGTPLNLTNLFRLSDGVAASSTAAYPRAAGLGGGDDEGEGDDEILPAMADDDYSAQLSWQSQSKDNLKVLMENFSPDQYDRFEAYRRHALPKQAVRKVIQQVTGQQASQPVAQIVAGFAKVFVGEIVEKARQVQARRGETGPLSPDHLREAYRMYQQETGNVGAARPVRAKKLFVR
ncbi:hTAFII28-like protein conserved region-domain-containing protein [Lentinula edodes]|nr:hTAFII28-like protein conserved region-domain-containing protein [Lentinula edodes]